LSAEKHFRSECWIYRTKKRDGDRRLKHELL
jgi:hypothetical protein